MRIWVVWKLDEYDEYSPKRIPISFHKKENTARESCKKKNENPKKEDCDSFYVLCHQVVD